mmetsp:Transcript_63790/g.120798  ORF Transcript_63790/g.120798 Transcript_63790/m.120798 type:complete len:684 (-) Transcript_63790:130-2181(-)
MALAFEPIFCILLVFTLSFAAALDPAKNELCQEPQSGSAKVLMQQDHRRWPSLWLESILGSEPEKKDAAPAKGQDEKHKEAGKEKPTLKKGQPEQVQVQEVNKTVEAPPAEPFLSDDGFKQVVSLNNLTAMLKFVKRVAAKTGMQETSGSDGFLNKLSSKQLTNQKPHLGDLVKDILESSKLISTVVVREGQEVPLNENGYKYVVQMLDDQQMATFITAAAQAAGYQIRDSGALSGVASFYSGNNGLQSFASLQDELKATAQQKQGWAALINGAQVSGNSATNASGEAQFESFQSKKLPKEQVGELATNGKGKHGQKPVQQSPAEPVVEPKAEQRAGVAPVAAAPEAEQTEPEAEQMGPEAEQTAPEAEQTAPAQEPATKLEATAPVAQKTQEAPVAAATPAKTPAQGKTPKANDGAGSKQTQKASKKTPKQQEAKKATKKPAKASQQEKTEKDIQKQADAAIKADDSKKAMKQAATAPQEAAVAPQQTQEEGQVVEQEADQATEQAATQTVQQEMEAAQEADGGAQEQTVQASQQEENQAAPQEEEEEKVQVAPQEEAQDSQEGAAQEVQQQEESQDSQKGAAQEVQEQASPQAQQEGEQTSAQQDVQAAPEADQEVEVQASDKESTKEAEQVVEEEATADTSDAPVPKATAKAPAPASAPAPAPAPVKAAASAAKKSKKSA